MSKRETHFFHISTSSGAYETFKDAEKAANAAKIWIQRLCEEKHYSAYVYIGISENEKYQGRFKVGPQGKKIFVCYKRKRASKTKPHLHIIVYGNPGQQLAQDIYYYFTQTQHILMEWYPKDCGEYLETAIEYAMFQSKKFRTITCDYGVFVEDETNTFFALCEIANRRMDGNCPVFKGYSDEIFNVCKHECYDDLDNQKKEYQYQKKEYPFTKSPQEETAKALINTMVQRIIDPLKELQCNIGNINNTHINNTDTNNTDRYRSNTPVIKQYGIFHIYNGYPSSNSS